MSAATMTEACGACGEEPLTCGECGDAFCPCQRVDNPPDIGYLMQELERCESHVCMAAVDIVQAWAFITNSHKALLRRFRSGLLEKRAEMRKGGAWTVNNS